ncbi:NADH:flavin oxidoreductase [Pseudomonas syringae]|uniref:NADH:flavin oxidoreductase n=1 Tax=Pseudomonas syringae TaxID=317 RepID=A0A9Q3X3P2_PSESX|nr:NADH:flavin oxidoreductase [Pseudomonas syringae]MCF5064626.1 NADH:flavin oxidoreductase [Pseudomonas syringae]MCF5071700.1 NADH:flavin oxidoreductase [Pseudomonas syringae]MCF5120624.1 NADH:flavin oxidoreductase [Pseudomonas syringae]MCF5379660.1 NADH:flavin oxidoreductase [Pseudomonas syringae]
MTDLSQKVLSKYVIKNASLANRLAVAPMTRVSATEDGLLTPAMHDYYLRFAKGGFGLIISEGLYTDQAFSQGYLYQPGLVSDAQACSWTATNQALQQQGTKVFAQLMHAGALSQGNRFSKRSAAPSAVQPVGEQMPFYYGVGRYNEPLELSEVQIAEVIQGFVDAAVRAVNISGFDGIEIHGAHGYLLDQFLTTYTNQRQDRWGGDIHARVALLLGIVKAIKAELGSKVPVGMRISQSKVNDFVYKWPGGEADAQVIFSSLAQAGADFIHVSEYRAWQPAFAGGQETLVALARRYAPGLTIIANGSLLDIGRANDALHDGADLIAQGEGALSNPDLPLLYASGREPRPFDNVILGPIANIKDSELAFGAEYA